MKYNVTIKPLGRKQRLFGLSAIYLSEDGVFGIMDKEGKSILYALVRAKVESISSNLIHITGFTIHKPQFVDVWCMSNVTKEHNNE
jgi:hypothetical protein